jgi:hypothetical protein
VVSNNPSGSITANFNDLAPNTEYYVRAYANHPSGTTYGNQISFTTHSFASVSTLDSLDILNAGQLNPVFDSKTTSYSLDVPSSLRSTKVVPRATNPKSMITVFDSSVASGQASNIIDLPYGTTLIEVAVVSQDGRTATSYRIWVTRKNSSVALLKTLSVNGAKLSPQFDPNRLVYWTTVSTRRTSVQIKTTAATPNSRITIAGKSLRPGEMSKALRLQKLGDTVVRIVVTAENGSQRTYRLRVIRKTMPK